MNSRSHHPNGPAASGPAAAAALELPGYTVTKMAVQARHTAIYHAVRDRDKKPVILKTLSDKVPTPQELAGLRLEHQILADLAMDGVPEAIELIADRRNLVLVMADVGISLDVLLRESIVSLREFLQIAVRLVDILGAIHSRDIYHRDLKPANIVIDPVTNRAAIIDFGLASRRRRDLQAAVGSGLLVGSVPYISPEQTGRMNRAVDYRTDFYSLGITFYEMLAGRLPFQDGDAMAMIHHHLTTVPLPPRELNPEIPPVLDALVLKMMAKSPDERYQSAAGAKADLTRIADLLEDKGRVATFPLGQRDVPLRFELSQKLYGRDQQTEQLLASFDQVAAGEVRMTLVAGYSGVGKTSLIHQLHKPIVARRGDFIVTKFDQYQRNVSYVALGQAFGGLIRQILTESPEQVEGWRTRILAALRSMGGLIIDVVPELELLIGKQPTVVQLSGSDAQARFVSLFERFLGVLATAEHPLVFFLDDLQWADQASLDFLTSLLDRNKSFHLLLLGAYRDNEVSPSHPLMLALDKIRQSQEIDTIQLEPLDLIDTNDFVADTLRRDPESTLDLTRLIHRRTGGNPFFLGRFLTTLYEDGKLAFDHTALEWQWSLEQIRGMEASLNVVELMVAKVRELPEATRDVLELAACLGNRFDLRTLSQARGENPRVIARRLQSAVAADCVIALDDAYRYYQTGSDEELPPVPPEEIRFKFLHDKVQEAVYSKIPPSDRQELHLGIGRVLRGAALPAAQDERLFDIVNHLNLGAPRISQQEEREQLAELNLAAGEKAMAAAAYPAARDYLSLGLELFTGSADPWTSHYTAMLCLHRNLCECEYLCANMEQAEAIFRHTLPQARDERDKANLYELMMGAFPTYGKFVEAIELGRECLRLYDIDLPQGPEAIRAALAAEHALIRDRMVEVDVRSLLDAPTTEDPRLAVSMAVLHRIWTNAYLLVDELYDLGSLCALKIVNLSLAHGHNDYSAFGYVIYGFLRSTDEQDYEAAFDFGQLALDLNKKFGNLQLVPKVNNMFAHTISHYKRPLAENIPLYEGSYKASIQCGDVWWGVWAINFLVLCRFIKGDRLSDVYAASQRYVDYVKSSGNRAMLLTLYFDQHLMLDLMGQIEAPGDLGRVGLKSEIFDEAEMVAHLESIPFEFMLFRYYIFRSFLCFLYDDHEGALSHSLKADEKRNYAPGFMLETEHAFLHGLILLANLPDEPDDERQGMLVKIDADIAQMQIWARHSPANYRHRFLLMSAERRRVVGETTAAMESYDRAITEAETTGHLHHWALANELAARFYLELGRLKIAWIYMFDAVQGYRAWGAEAKAEQLDRTYRDLLASHTLYRQRGEVFDPSLSTSRTRTSHSHSGLDLDALLKASRILSGETDRTVLLSKFIEVGMRYAGALRTCLIFPYGEDLVVQGEGYLQAEDIAVEILKSVSLEDYDNLPRDIIQYVFRSGEELVLDNASEQGMFTQDPHVLANRSKSILCIPLINQGATVAITYMENDQLAGAFTENHLDILRLLVSQATISFENVLLKDVQEASDFQFQVGGSLAGDSPTYVRRQADRELYRAIRSGEFCFVLNARQMGKSSLRVHTMQRLSRENYACVSIDITSIGSRQVTPEQWYAGVTRKLVTGLGLSRQIPLRKWWREQADLSPVQRLSEVIDLVLSHLEQPVVVFIDEIDSVRSLDFNLDDFFAAIRAVYNQRADDPRYERLTFVLLGVALPSELIQDKDRTPFNIGRSIQLAGFRASEAKSLARGLAVKSEYPDVLLREILAWTNGQPFLTQRVCRLVVEAKSAPISGREPGWIKNLVTRRVINNWEVQDDPEHLKTIRARIIRSPEKRALLPLYQEILTNGSTPFSDSAVQAELLLTGLVRRDWDSLKVSNNIYASVFNLEWIGSESTATTRFKIDGELKALLEGGRGQ